MFLDFKASFKEPLNTVGNLKNLNCTSGNENNICSTGFLVNYDYDYYDFFFYLKFLKFFTFSQHDYKYLEHNAICANSIFLLVNFVLRKIYDQH